mgnify:CR=1 FL=1
MSSFDPGLQHRWVQSADAPLDLSQFAPHQFVCGPADAVFPVAIHVEAFGIWLWGLGDVVLILFAQMFRVLLFNQRKFKLPVSLSIVHLRPPCMLCGSFDSK